MQSSNGHIRPDTVTYNTVLKACCNAGQLSKAMQVPTVPPISLHFHIAGPAHHPVLHTNRAWCSMMFAVSCPHTSFAVSMLFVMSGMRIWAPKPKLRVQVSSFTRVVTTQLLAVQSSQQGINPGFQESYQTAKARIALNTTFAFRAHIRIPLGRRYTVARKCKSLLLLQVFQTMVQSRVELTITTFGTLLIAGADAREYALVKEVLCFLCLTALHNACMFAESLAIPYHCPKPGACMRLSLPWCMDSLTHHLARLLVFQAGTATEPHMHVLPQSHL